MENAEKKKEDNFTIRHLLQPSSGLDNYKNIREQENTSKYRSLKDAISIFKDRDLISVPGHIYLDDLWLRYSGAYY